ncbi:hypothetical protein [Streptomyces sp. NBC_00503]|uniref:hypothetical protein n=1 Tax=Streptomyces sp. NBC_00503 TaxID=2903659 RepID=UPI002E80EC37|nr:hypothetical protein [Streptomyces sp. NBC_00503]WUD81388.1 hypothetical protein OG490_13020 [Streptomyces sp. NBC_00503]
MDNGLIALGAAVVGVAGTLLATVLSQRMVAGVQAAQFEREQRVAQTRWLRERELAEQARRRDCYTAANAAYRRYRIALMSFLWLARGARATPEERTVLEEARSTHHVAFAEAQMVASSEVLAELDLLTEALSGTYHRTVRLGQGDPVANGSFEEIHAELLGLGARWERMRAAMRVDLGVDARDGADAPDRDGRGLDGRGAGGRGVGASDLDVPGAGGRGADAMELGGRGADGPAAGG